MLPIIIHHGLTLINKYESCNYNIVCMQMKYFKMIKQVKYSDVFSGTVEKYLLIYEQVT